METTVYKISSSIGENYSEEDLNLISSFEVFTNFTKEKDTIEFSIYNEQNLLEYIDYNYTDYSVVLSSTTDKNTFSTIEIDPKKGLKKEGYTQGNYVVNYNFLRNQLSSSQDLPFYIKEISSDRTEIRIATNNIDNSELEVLVSSFKEALNSLSYFEDFYINFGNNNLYLANNILLDKTNENQYSVLIKLYEPLEVQFNIKNVLWVVTQTTNEISYKVSFPNKIIAPPSPKFLRGPNLDIEKKDTINNSTTFQNLSELTNSSLTSSYNQLQQIINEKGIKINIDYSDFNEFVNFSSAEQRTRNFYYKVGLIQEYSSSIRDLLSQQTGAPSNVSSSIAIFEKQTQEIIANFDGYEQYQYYTSGSSNTYPKGNVSNPYILLPTGSNEVLTWLEEQTSSGSEYDQENRDRLVNSLPEYTKEDDRNSQFLLFMDMVGQHFDNIWVYTKDLSNRFDADNRLTYGISKDLVADAIKSMGVSLYQNNFTNDNLYTAFTLLHSDSSSGALPIPSNEFITDYVSINYEDTGKVVAEQAYQEGQVFYWSVDGIQRSENFYVKENFTTPQGNVNLTSYLTALLGYQGVQIQKIDDLNLKVTPIDNINKELYKRIFHNLPYLLKKKGTIEGLRALINTYGIPDSALRISEFGGKDKNNINDWDYFQNSFNYAWDISGSLNTNVDGMGGEFPFTLNEAWGSSDNVPESVAFRFKLNPPEGVPDEDTYVALMDFNTGGTNGVLALEYTGSGYSSASYSGSIPSSSNEYANLAYYDGNTKVVSVDAPFYNNDWWVVYINKNSNTYTLRTGNKTYEGPDGFKVNFYSSSQANGGNTWSSTLDLEIPGADVTIGSNTYKGFTGSIQEIRYYNCALDENTFYDFVMNSDSIEGSTFSSSADNLCFRARLKDKFTRSTPSSDHPRVTGSFTTHSFSSNSEYRIWNKSNSYVSPHTEFTYQDQSAVGVKNRVSQKIKNQEISIPSGDTLSLLTPIQQNYLTPKSGSYTKDINLLEVAFSPQNEINDDINASLGYFNIGEYIGDPRQILESVNSYPDLGKLRDTYFEKYYKNYNWTDYVRLIKFFDNSLFKMIKDFTPAKTNLASGVVIKQHLLERNKQRTTLVTSSLHDYTGSIIPGFINGGTGGTFNEINDLGTNPYWQASGSSNAISPQLTQSWEYTSNTLMGPIEITQSSQDEFYNGELSGSHIQVSEANITPNIISNGFSTSSFNAFSNNIMRASNGEIFFGETDYENYLTSANHLVMASYSPDNNQINTFYIPQILAQAVYIHNINIDYYFDRLDSNDYILAGIASAGLPTTPFRNFLTELFLFKVISVQPKLSSPVPYYKIFVEQKTNSPLFENYYTQLPSNVGGNPIDFQKSWRIYYGGEKIGGTPTFLNAINNNIDTCRKSKFYSKIEYDSTLTQPTNIEAIKNNNAVAKASIQDSNYSREVWKRSRYEGTKMSSVDFNIPTAK